MLTIHVCIGSACHVKGSYNVVNTLQRLISDRQLGDRVILKTAFCLGECSDAISVKVNDGAVVSVKKDKVEEFFEKYVISELDKHA